MELKRCVKMETKITILLSVLMCGVADMRAQHVDGVDVSDWNATHDGRYMTVDMDLDMKDLEVKSNRAVLLTPRLVNGADSVDLKSVGVYGRRRYYYYVRNSESMLTGADELSYRANQKPGTLSYTALVPYETWMNGAELRLERAVYGCCGDVLDMQNGRVGLYNEAFFPTLVYLCPKGETEKHQTLRGSAFIDFPVDKTVIYPDYRRNVTELDKINKTIDSVCADRDITITQVWLKGYASPESPYSHNSMLAQGRTAALEKYLQNLYQFQDGVIVTAYEPEDWEGLRRYVESSNLANREGILGLIDSDLVPDEKEQRIKAKYPEDYRFLLQNCYPALRHTDYRIEYSIRSYTDIEEIKRVMQSQPQKLSLNEFYLLSEQYEPGSDEFTEVFETAVLMYPADANANLNAANAAMRRNDLKSAARYLEKAGSSPEAVYARAAYAIRNEDYDTARNYLQEAANGGLEQAKATLDELNKRTK